jgi:hypothetical protein
MRRNRREGGREGGREGEREGGKNRRRACERVNGWAATQTGEQSNKEVGGGAL